MNHDRAWVATRKGLFELRRDSAGWRIERISFLGEPVSMLLPPQGDGAHAGGAEPGALRRQAACLGRCRRHTGTRWPRRAYPTQPADATGPGLEAGADLGAGGGARHGLGRHACRAGCSARPIAASRGSWSNRCGTGRSAPSGSAAATTCPASIRSARTRSARASCWSASAAAASGSARDDGASWALQADGMRAAYMPPEQADNPNTQDPHRHRALRGGARGAVVPASQRHLALHRQRAYAGTRSPAAPVSSFGFAVAVHPRRAGHGLVRAGRSDECRVPVDGAMVVNRTRDGGAAFETLRAGLPQQHCYDLVYRHGLAVAPDGRTLLMGSTTGSLWASDGCRRHLAGSAGALCRRSMPCAWRVGLLFLHRCVARMSCGSHNRPHVLGTGTHSGDDSQPCTS